jgi:hypothetical protein|tara:strand:+ start:3530 stop:3799 length:270 start_codon:yes stop_codon:yes gene_type:complete
MLLPDGYIRRTSSTIPFGYEESSVVGHLKPVPEQLEALEVVEDMLNKQEISLQTASDWLDYKVGRTLSKAGLKKHMDKKYGKERQTNTR